MESPSDFEIPLLSPDFLADPRPTWRRLREQAPLYWSSRFGFWVVSRFDDASAILRDPDAFSSAIGPAGGMRDELDDGAGRGVGFLPMIQNDPPHHTRLRRILSRAFSPKRIAAMEPRIREIGRGLAAEIRCKRAAGEPLDLYADFASPLPVIVIAEILGIPEEVRGQLRFWAEATAVGSGELHPAELRRSAVRQIGDCLEALIAERTRRPTDDLVSALVGIAASDEERLRPGELLGFCKLLWIAGNETTTNLISNGALVLQDLPELRQRLRAEPDRIPDFVEEALRFESPVNGLFRILARDVELAGHDLRKGQPVWVLFGSANRDPAHFRDPDRFDLDRRERDHLAFGLGIHFCLGAALARLEARVAFETLVPLLDELHLHPERGRRVPTPILRGWLELPMTPR